MDGIVPAPQWQSPTARLKVKYLATAFENTPTGISFDEYPRHHSIDHFEDATTVRRGFSDIISLASFMQGWLFFKPLEIFLGQPINLSDFVVDGYVDLDQPLSHSYFTAWKSRLWLASYPRKQAFRRATEDMVRSVMAKSTILEDAADHFGPDEEFDRVALSVKLLAALLIVILEETFSKSTGTFSPWFRRFSKSCSSFLRILIPSLNIVDYLKPDFADDFVSELSDGELQKHLHGYQKRLLPLPPGDAFAGRAAGLCLRILEANGWCPFRARQLCKTYDYSTVNHIAAMTRPRPTDENHARCLLDGRCSAHDVETQPSNAYSFRHDCGGQCPFICVPFEDLATIIYAGEIPIISMSTEGPLDIKVIRRTPRTTYTAISHVWSDGRGNPNQNALPSCQLEWLRDTISRSYRAEANVFYDPERPFESVYQHALSSTLRRGRPVNSFDAKRICFWMDTLCVPVCSETESIDAIKELRFAAIKQITPIFSASFNTLILDQQIQSHCIDRPEQVCGDEFATILFTSKWMERGWTLEEGCLSSMCVVFLSGKLYEINMALRNLMPAIHKGDSPLRRAGIDIRRMTTKLLHKALLEDKRQVAIIPWIPKAQRIWRQMQQSIFVSVWNSLTNRATTRPQDGILILANLLDYNVNPLRLVSKELRLMAVLKSCNQLPLSLMYNTGPRLNLNGHPELGWIPTDVVGDNLVVGAQLLRTKSIAGPGQVTYTIELGRREQESILVLHMLQNESIANATELFRVQLSADQNCAVATGSYIIQLIRASRSISYTSSAEPWFQQDSAQRCLLIDLKCGTNQSRGFVARGVCFRIHKSDGNKLTVSYETPLLMWTIEQWKRKTGNSDTLPNLYRVSHLLNIQKLFMHFDADLWRNRLARRPLYSMYPIWAQLVATVIYLITLLMTYVLLMWLLTILAQSMGFASFRAPLIRMVILTGLGLLLIAFVYAPIRSRLSMRAYERWIKTFNDSGIVSEMQPTSEATASSNAASSLGMAKRVARGLRRFLLRGRRRAIDDGLPGDISLE